MRGIVEAKGFRGIAATGRCKWPGERMDYSLAIESMQLREAAAAAAAAAIAAGAAPS